MVRQIAQARRVQRDAPRGLRYFEPVSEQWMNRMAHPYPARYLQFPPMTVRLERIGRQLDGLRPGGMKLSPIDFGPERIQPAERSEQRRTLAIVPPQRAQRRARRRLFAQALGDVVP